MKYSYCCYYSRYPHQPARIYCPSLTSCIMATLITYKTLSSNLAIYMFICWNVTGVCWSDIMAARGKTQPWKQSRRRKGHGGVSRASYCLFPNADLTGVHQTHVTPVIWLDVLFQSSQPVRLTRQVKADAERCVNTRVSFCLPWLFMVACANSTSRSGSARVPQVL